MAVAIRGSGSGGSTGTGNLAVVSSSAPVAGDHIYLIVTINNSSSGSHPTPASTGFSSLGSSTASVWSRTTLLGKIATGSEGTSFTISGFAGSDSKFAVVLVLSGASAGLTSNVVTTPDASSNTTHSIAAITTAAANSMDIVAVGYGGNNDYGAPGAFGTWGTSFVELIDNGADSGGGFYYAGLGVATVIRASAGAQAATSVVSEAADVNSCIRFEVQEAGGGAATSLLLPSFRMPMSIIAR